MAEVEISFDASRIDFDKTSEVIKASYWGEGRTDEIHRRAFANSLCLGAYVDGEQVGFARVVTDYACFAYVADVIVWPGRRGLGIGKKLIQALLDHPELASVTGFSLRTSDAHSLYKKFGFVTSTDGMYMRLARQPATHE
ncbi:GNAT superfamily N-acetyltransferase [Aminobacter niigataensis]|uniref:GNAT superfamily N-acetyltransferase n=1 Tax=Aminobacter niigataensis TaxID=83265 RepID=A0ABR6KWY6_9HYPH|nr:GNAT family N-acetyltransferase [Aminobacter niigataensis]MBB4649043.1 GNAT superfamily N-acetyltransferase [Aminobacter niigataensis]